jgi:hypothetical protein
MDLPDLARFSPHRVVDPVDLDGVVLPGLSARFLRRPAGSDGWGPPRPGCPDVDEVRSRLAALSAPGRVPAGAP